MAAQFFELLALGVAVGAFGSLVGIGGGIVFVTVYLLFLLGTTFDTVQQVIGTSLFAVLLNAVSGAWAYWKQGRIILRAAVPFSIATVPGAFLASWVTEGFSSTGFEVFYGCCLLCIGTFLFWKSHSKAANRAPEGFSAQSAELAPKKLALGCFFAFLVGFYSSLVGVGGGLIHVPVLVFLLGFPPHIAVATSTFVMMVSSLVGVASHALLDHIVWVPALAAGIGCLAGAQIGAFVAKKSRPRFLVLLLAGTMLCMGTFFVLRGSL